MKIALIIACILSLLWTLFVYLRYVVPAQAAKTRGEDLERELRRLRGPQDLVVVVTPAWRVFVRLANGAPLEAFVEEDVRRSFDVLVAKAHTTLEGATTAGPSSGSRARPAPRRVVDPMPVEHPEGTWTLDSPH